MIYHLALGVGVAVLAMEVKSTSHRNKSHHLPDRISLQAILAKLLDITPSHSV